MDHRFYLSIGSNLGDRLGNLKTAISSFPPNIKIEASSPVYETEPWGYADQPLFLNVVVSGRTDVSALELLSVVKEIENKMGRQETFRFGPRLIDLDILLFDELIMDTPVLTIPHPRILERAFVLIPLADLAPDLAHPETGVSMNELKASMDTRTIKLFHSSLI